MKRGIVLMTLAVWGQLGCRVPAIVEPDLGTGLPGEELVTIIRYSNPLEQLLSTCEKSWHIGINNKTFKASVVPIAF